MFLELSVNITELPKGLPAVHARKRIDSLTFERYPGQGLRIQPLASWWFARDTARHGDVEVTKRMLDKALEISVRSPAARCTTEYLFPFGSGAPPWSSPMAHSLAMDALARGFALTGDEQVPHAALGSRKGVASAATSRRAAGLVPDLPVRPGPAGAERRPPGDHRPAAGLQARRRRPLRRPWPSRPRRRPRTACRATTRVPGRATPSSARRRSSTTTCRRSSSATSARRSPTRSSASTARRSPTTAPRRRRSTSSRAAQSASIPVPADGFRDTFAVKFTVTKLSTVVATWRRNGKKVLDEKLGLLSGGRHSLRWSPGRARAGFYTIGFTAKDLAGNRGSVTDPRGVRDRARQDAADHRQRPVQRRPAAVEAEGLETPWVDVIIKVGKKSKTLHKRHLSASVKLTKAPSLVTFRDSSGNRSGGGASCTAGH